MAEALEPEVMKPDVSGATEVHHSKGVPELLWGTQRGLVSIYQQICDGAEQQE